MIYPPNLEVLSREGCDKVAKFSRNIMNASSLLLLWLCTSVVRAEIDDLELSCFPFQSRALQDRLALGSWTSRAYTEFADVKLAVLPLGSLEQHGPHLPVGTDLLLAVAFAASIESPQVAVLPASPFGASFEHAAFPGTIAVEDDTLNALWISIVTSVARSGVQRILLLNGHGGQSANAEMVARKIRFDIKPNVLVTVVNLQSLLQHVTGTAVAQMNRSDHKKHWEWESKYGIHAGFIETSLMLHLHPNLVQANHVKRFEPRENARYGLLEPHGPTIAYGWKAQDLSETGAIGDATLANSEIGQQIFLQTISVLSQLVRDVLAVAVEEVFVESKPGNH